MAGSALGQSQRNVYTQRNDQFNEFGAEPTGPDVAVSGLAALVCGNKQIGLYSRTTALPAPGPLDLLFLHDPSPDPGTQSPFTISTTFPLIDRFLDPRATYDSANDRLWMVYSETDGDKSTGDCGSLSKLHIAVSKDPDEFMPTQGVLDSLGTGHWWYYTGPTDRTPPPTTGSIDLRYGTLGFPFDDEFKPYKGVFDGSNGPLEGMARLPTIAVDGTRASGRGVAVITPNTFEPKCDGTNAVLQPQLEQSILIVPLEHEDDMGNPRSILEGDRPDETDMILINLWSDDSNPDSDRLEDFAEAAYAVQEPYEAYDNAVFLISGTSNRVDATRKDAIRLKGLFYDATAPTDEEWTLQQRISSTGALEDVDINGSLTVDSAFAYHDGLGLGSTPRPRTPDMSILNWGPAAVPSIFHSAVLTEDTEGNPRIFAVHSVFPIDPSDPDFGLPVWVVQWYVIDPDFTNFRATPAPSSSWNPTIVATGRIHSENGTGDRYHPVIVVNRQGQAFIEYTYSDDETWPEIRRVRLNNTYTGIVGSETPAVLSGPAVPFKEGPVIGDPLSPRPSWANFAGAQADPFNNCAYWSTHTLVHDDPVEDPTDKRDVWLFHQAYDSSTSLCFQNPTMLDLTDDGEVDAYDMLEFTAMYDRRARRVDINGDGVVDAIDMALYLDAYDAYTRGR